MDQTFSQRYGYEPLPEPMKLEELSSGLRTELWNAVRKFLLANSRAGMYVRYFDTDFRGFLEYVLGQWSGQPEDEIPSGFEDLNQYLKTVLLEERFNRVLDLLEILVNSGNIAATLRRVIERSFERHAAAYWLNTKGSQVYFVQRSSGEQGEAVSISIETLHEARMDGAASHLRKASEHMRLGGFADSIRESIHAVESVARRIDPKASETLAPALNSLEGAGLLKHNDLTEGMKKLYWYTCDEQGIRHALLDQSSADVDIEEALFMFGACASFAAYLATKSEQLGD